MWPLTGARVTGRGGNPPTCYLPVLSPHLAKEKEAQKAHQPGALRYFAPVRPQRMAYLVTTGRISRPRSCERNHEIGRAHV